MTVPFFLVDAFTNGPFTGNPAGVCLCEKEPSEAWMSSVGSEVNHAETAFVWPNRSGHGLRWFTPTSEVDLCGHATLAAAHAMYSTGRVPPEQRIEFTTKSGVLTCSVDDGLIQMDFPAETPYEDTSLSLDPRLGLETTWEGANRMDLICVLLNEESVVEFVPNMDLVAKLGHRGLAITAKSSDPVVDYVCRFFAPQVGVPEDSVTGSLHCALAPYWRSVLGKDQLKGLQLSKRTGLVHSTVYGDRVILKGGARTVITGTLEA